MIVAWKNHDKSKLRIYHCRHSQHIEEHNEPIADSANQNPVIQSA